MNIVRRSTLLFAVLASIAAMMSAPVSLAAEKVRVGVLKYGTVSWELDTIKHHGIDAANGIDLEVSYFAGEDATNVAMLAGELDVIVSDWLWVSRQRAAGDDLTLIPYSTAVGAIMVRRDSPMRTLADLKHKKIGVAGGPLDKSWLLIQAQAERDFGFDLPNEAEIVYGAPPLLAEKAMQGELDAVLNFWHYCARLEANGFRRLTSAEVAATALGAKGKVSALGYVFHEQWAEENPAAVNGFAKASAAAKQLLATSDEEWLRLAPMTRAEGEELDALRNRFREGIPGRAIDEERADAALLYGVLAQIGGEKLVGSEPEMADGTYFSGLSE
ncbi:ABC transporter substrate-binding protein [Mesorhizobium xinjiangense]|uniref:ABC transporter substrate-binding protein n=1 Tax=Mesorhizobium xinjiangense TaxID=2678685 RepID=UPI0012EEB75F|nr:ABC transporter substrate-binding protein [Mesorhizobium xinjiangense]